MKLFDNFRDPNLRTQKTIMFTDIVDSTGMKEREAEAAWLTTFGYFFDLIAEVIIGGEAGGVIKFLGDGAMVVYSEDNATQAINDAIRIQELMTDDVDRKTVSLGCSIGIGMGEVVEFETPRNETDYLGIVCDRAARLCSIASAGAIFVDTATTASAQMNKVHSTIGAALRRATDEYQGPVERASVPGFVTPVEYHEIKWGQQLFGVKSKVVTAAAADRSLTVPVAPAVAPRVPFASGTRGIRGTVKRWDSELGRGWIVATETGEEFFCTSNTIVDSEEIGREDIVYFCPFGVAEAGKCRVATGTIFLGQEVTAVVTTLREGYGFLQVRDPRENVHDVFFSMAEAPAGIAVNDVVLAVVAETGRGVRAEEVRHLDASAKAA